MGLRIPAAQGRIPKLKFRPKRKMRFFFFFFLWSDKESNEQSIGLTNEEKLN